MQYENLTDKQKQCIEMFRSWSEKLTENEVKNYKFYTALPYSDAVVISDIRYKSADGIFVEMSSMIRSLATYLKLSRDELNSLFVFMRDKNYWLKFTPRSFFTKDYIYNKLILEK